MDNLKLPAYPLPISHDPAKTYSNDPATTPITGFTKLELASLMIAHGRLSNPNLYLHPSADGHQDFAFRCTSIAKAVLQEANK